MAMQDEGNALAPMAGFFNSPGEGGVADGRGSLYPHGSHVCGPYRSVGFPSFRRMNTAQTHTSFPFSGKPDLELPHEAKLGAGAPVAVELRVGLALLVHHDELGTEAEGREGAAEDGDA